MKIRSQFSGNIAADVVVKSFESGKKLAEFSIAVNGSKFENGEYVDSAFYHDCKLPGHEKIHQYLTKGKLVEVSGSWEYDHVPIENTEKKFKKYSLIVDEIKLLGSKE